MFKLFHKIICERIILQPKVFINISKIQLLCDANQKLLIVYLYNQSHSFNGITEQNNEMGN